MSGFGSIDDFIANEDREVEKNHGGGHYITVVTEDKMRREYDLVKFGKSAVTFGRSDKNDIQILSEIVTSQHGIFMLEHGRCYIIDRNSTNGIFINGVKISEKTLLHPGDSIRIDNIENPHEKGVLIVYSDVCENSDWDEYFVEGGTITIGRGDDCDIKIDHVAASKYHAQIRSTPNGVFLYECKGSGGVLVNGTRVIGSVELKEKDVILIADMTIIYSDGMLLYKTEQNGYGITAESLMREVTAGKRRKKILHEMSFEIKPCEFVAVIGGSGAGKSTLVNILNGFDRPTKGHVFINGEDLHKNYAVLKNKIGYVPQSDIIYENLTLIDMLMYVAKLRMPMDTGVAERKARVEYVIKTVELEGRENTLIRKLSGGQKKRASLAVELIADPGIFFLDEPGSGLDPGTERNLMKTLKRMSDNGKTIVLITHNTQNLILCDRIILLGTGGRLCFNGSPAEAKEFFGVSDIIDAYNLVSVHPEYWEAKFAALHENDAKKSKKKKQQDTPEEKTGRKDKVKVSVWRQFAALTSRYAALMMHDKFRLLFLLLQAPLISYLFSFVAPLDGAFSEPFSAEILLFCMSCAAVWVGLINSIQEVCKERSILRREYMANLSLRAYIMSKLAVQAVLALIQSALMLIVFIATVGKPASGLILPDPTFEMYVTLFLSVMSSVAIGIVVSSMSKNPDRAMVLAPVLLIPQLLFSGVLFQLGGAAQYLGWFTVSRWSMQAFGATADLNGMFEAYFKPGSSLLARYTSDMFNQSAEVVLSAWGVMLGACIVFAVISVIILTRLPKDKK